MFVVIGAATEETGRLDGTVGIAPPVGAARSGPDMLRIPLRERLQTRIRMTMPQRMGRKALSPRRLLGYHTVDMVDEMDGMLVFFMVHSELQSGTGAREQSATSRRETFRLGSHVEPAVVHREVAGPDAYPIKAPAQFTALGLASDQNVTGLVDRAAGMDAVAQQGPARRRALRAGVKSRAFRAWKASQQ